MRGRVNSDRSSSRGTGRGGPGRGSSRGPGRGPGAGRGRMGEDRFPREMVLRKRKCNLCKDKIKDIDYKEIGKLQRYTSERGKILSSRITGNCAKHQRKLAQAIKRARFIALLPYVKIGTATFRGRGGRGGGRDGRSDRR